MEIASKLHLHFKAPSLSSKNNWNTYEELTSSLARHPQRTFLEDINYPRHAVPRDETSELSSSHQPNEHNIQLVSSAAEKPAPAILYKYGEYATSSGYTKGGGFKSKSSDKHRNDDSYTRTYGMFLNVITYWLRLL
jgi:hypothetical protein